jgi:hypothetical protein
MSGTCGKRPDCGFFRKYSDAGQARCDGTIKIYCCGPRGGACEREVYRKTYNTTPPDEMMPSGMLLA